METLTSALLAILLSVPVSYVDAPPHAMPVPHAIAMNTWQYEQGDGLIVDTKNNTGYLFHEDGRYISFPVVTGQRRRVYYIGRSYFAATPNRQWNGKSLEIKGDRVTFGPSGKFLRLFSEQERTLYGIHTHRDEDIMFQEDEPITRYRSMGCIIVQKNIMDLIEITFHGNEERLNVITLDGVVNLGETMTALREDIKNVETDGQYALY